MPYQPIAKFSGPLGFPRNDQFKRPVTFYDRVRFVGATSTVEIFGGVITGDISLAGNLQSSDWDGGDDLSGGYDSGATLGWLLDWDNGAAQFEGSVFVGGDMVLTTSGSKFYTNPAVPRLALQGGGALFINAEQGATLADGNITFFTGPYAVQLLAATDTGYDAGLVYAQSASVFNEATVYLDNETARVQVGSTADADYILLDAATIDIEATQVLANDGSAAAPMWSYEADPDTGIFRKAVNTLAFATTGVERLVIQSDGNLSGPGTYTSTAGMLIRPAVGGNAASPTYAFNDDANTGMYRFSADTWALTAGGVPSLLGNPTYAVIGGANTTGGPRVTVAAGTAGAPAFTFTGDVDTGMYRYGLNAIGWAAGGNLKLTLAAVGDLYIGSDGNVAGAGYIKGSAAGTDAAPTFSFQQDYDTGFYRFAADKCAISTGGSARIYWDSNGTHLSTLTTTGSAANLHAATGSGNRILRSTSARKYKTQERPAPELADIILRPSHFWRDDDQRFYYGQIADDLAAQEPLLGLYGPDGEVENYDDRALMAVMAAKINRLEAFILTEQTKSGIL